MADCSELSMHIFKMVQYHVNNTKGVNNSRQAAELMAKENPGLNANQILISIHEAATLGGEVHDQMENLIAGIKKSGTVEQKKAASDLEKHLKSKKKKATQKDLNDLRNDMKTMEAFTLDDDESKEKLSRLAKVFAKAIAVESEKDDSGRPILSREELISKVHDELSEVFQQEDGTGGVESSLSRDQVIDALGNYGLLKKLPSDPVSVMLREYYAELRTVSQLRDINKGVNPLKSGGQMDNPTLFTREQRKKLEEAKRQRNYMSKDNELSSAQDRVISYLQNRIETIQSIIDNGRKEKSTVTPTQDNAEILALKQQKKELEAEFEKLFGEEIDLEKRIASAISTAEKSLTMWKKKMDGTYKKLESKPLPKHAKLDSIRAERDRIRDEYFDSENAPNVARMREKAAELQRHLDAKTLPDKITKDGRKLSKWEQKEKDLVDKLRKEIQKSPQAQANRWKNQIDNLQTKMEATEYIPPVRRDDSPMNDANRKTKTALDKLKSRANRYNMSLEQNHNKSFFMKAVDAVGLSRTLRTVGDVSGIGRQGLLLLAANPKKLPSIVYNAFMTMHPTKGEAHFRMVMDKYFSAENGMAEVKFHEGKVKISDVDASASISAHEEMFGTKHVDKMIDWDTEKHGPFLNALANTAYPVALGLKSFERSYTLPLNELRMSNFNLMMATMTKGGLASISEKEHIGSITNIFSGVGDLGKQERNAQWLNFVMFAAKYTVSRFQTATLYPVWGFKDSQTNKSAWQLRKENPDILKNHARQYALGLLGWATLTSMAYMFRMAFGDDEEELSLNIHDPRASDLFKTRHGRVLVDAGGGMAQALVFLARTFFTAAEIGGSPIDGFGSQTHNNTEGNPFSGSTGKTRSLRDGDWGKMNFSALLGSLAMSKSAPVVSTLNDIMNGENMLGEKFTVFPQGMTENPITAWFESEHVLKNLMMPMITQDVYDLYREEGLTSATILSLAAFMGIGVQVHNKH